MAQLVGNTCYQSKDTCNGSCLTKTYNYQNLASVTFTAKQEDGINYFSIILTGYNIKENEYQQVSVVIDGDPGNNTYSCERNSSGETGSYYTHSFVQHTAGSTLYRDNILYCFWTMSRTTSSWPKRSDGSSLDLEIHSNHKILLTNGDISFLVSKNTKDLPIHRLNFLKCCNDVYGNDKVQLFVRQTNNANEFTLQLNKDNFFMPSFISIAFNASDESILAFVWTVQGPTIYATLQMKYVGLAPIQSQILYNYSWSSVVYFWSIPIVVKGLTEDYDTRKRVYDLKIILDLRLVYSKRKMALTSLATIHIASDTTRQNQLSEGPKKLIKKAPKGADNIMDKTA
uniref:Uncharacterized protein n=1 Tax=Tetranychus urticae TaxID=32264 RepID=T1K432_TETUR